MSRRFLRRIGDGSGQLAVLNPSSLPNLEIYLSGLNGITPLTNLASLTSWKDQSGNARDFGVIPPGAVAPIVLKDFVKPGVSAISISTGASSRSIENNALPAFTQTRGSTQYSLASMNTGNTQGWNAFFWPSGANDGPSLYYQAAGFSGNGGSLWSSGTVPAGNMAIQIGSTGYDIGIASPVGRWDLWTIVSDLSNNQLVYHNGALVATFPGVTYGFSSTMFLGDRPSSGNQQFGEEAAYLLYTATHTPGQIAAVYAWFKAFYGI